MGLCRAASVDDVKEKIFFLLPAILTLFDNVFAD